jgi:cardiolipin synthase A/B
MQVFQPGHTVDLLHSGAEFFPALQQAIDASEHEVRLETYLFHFDAAGEAVACALVNAARRGVQVFLLMDGVGTPEVPPTWAEQFRQAGVAWRRFSPMGSLGLLIPGRWRRLHRKLCVVDRQLAFCGGINVIDDFEELGHGRQTVARLDFAVRVRGPLVAEALVAMEQLWRRLLLREEIGQLQLRHVRHLLTQDAVFETAAPRPAVPGRGASQGVRAALVLRDNVRFRNRIERAYLHALAHARREVVIANAYFIPGRKLRRALLHAARRGVRVRLLLQGRYEFFMQYHASKPVYAELLAAGVEIYEYQVAFLHAKVAVVDGRWATVGSSNLDPLSLLLAREANVLVRDVAFSGRLLAALRQAMELHSLQVRSADLQNRHWSQRLKDRLAYGLMRLTLLLTGRRY